MMTAQTIAQGWEHHQAGRFAEAERVYRGLLGTRPRDAELRRLLGGALLAQGRIDDAIQVYREALLIHPDYAEAHNNLGVALARQDNYADAALAFGEALRCRPDYPDALSNLGNALRERKEMDEAIRRLTRALELQPDFAQAHTNLGAVFFELGRLDEAAFHHREALRLKPDFPDALGNLAAVLIEQARPKEALPLLEEGLRLKPDLVLAHNNRAVVWLIQGDYERGWPEYEWRWQSKDMPARNFAEPRWDGSPLPGRTILVYAEQGLGDTLQFIRFVPFVQRLAGRVVFECPAALIRLLADFPGIDELTPYGSPLPPFDVQVPLLSIPGLLGTRLATVPAETPYLRVQDDLRDYWRRQLASIRGLKVGIAWQGNPRYPKDRQRSIPLRHFDVLAKAPNVRLISLQKNLPEEKPIPGDRVPVIDYGHQLDTLAGPFMDTAALISNLDLVISADTAVAHLAAALGAPVWLLLAFSPDWRWTLEGETTPWYPTMRIFRQRALNDWQELFQRVESQISSRGNHRHGQSPDCRDQAR